jgi:hypothetical protein
MNGGVTGGTGVGRRLQQTKGPFFALQYKTVDGSKTFACLCIAIQNVAGWKTTILDMTMRIMQY